MHNRAIYTAGAACLLLLGAAALTGCQEDAAEQGTTEPEFSEAETVGSEPPSPATVAMRWNLLNPEVNSFTFRNTQQVFAFREVHAPDEALALSTRDGFTMPMAESADGQIAYQDWADRTFTNAFLVIRDGEIVFEDYRNRMDESTPHIAFSMTKTITAMLIGQALERGEIASLDDVASKYVPELADGAYGKATIRNILEMRSGADIMERYDFGANPSLAAEIHEKAIVNNEARFADFAVGIPARAEPGAEFNYATLDTAVLGWILENATGMRIEQLMEDRIWKPMGAERDAHFLADGPVGVGRALNGMGFNATLRDFGRLGQLLLDDGVVDGTRILPEGWVASMTEMKPTGRPGYPGYGLQTWQVGEEPGAFAAVGLAGQYIYVHPGSRSVIVKLSYNPPVEPEWLIPEVVGYFEALANSR